MRTIVYCTTTRLLQLHEFNPFICSGQTPNRAHGGHVTRRALFQMDWLMSQLLLIFIVKFIPFFLCFWTSPILSYQYAMHSEIKWSKEVGWLPWIETSATLHHNFPQNFHKFWSWNLEYKFSEVKPCAGAETWGQLGRIFSFHLKIITKDITRKEK